MESSINETDAGPFFPPYRREGLVFVLSGPSGVGKDSVLAELRKMRNDLRKVLTATTRPPRPGELDKVDYLFWTTDEFQQHVQNGDLLEHAQVYENHYGTPLASVRDALAGGGDILLKVDVQGAATAREKLPTARLVFLAPPSLEELSRRLRRRGTESDSSFQTRLAKALEEMKRLPEFDYVVVNDDLATAAREVSAVITAEQNSVSGIEGLTA